MTLVMFIKNSGFERTRSHAANADVPLIKDFPTTDAPMVDGRFFVKAW